MTIARNIANIFSSGGTTLPNFSSTGIDDNADANAITINSSEQVGIGTGSGIDKELHVQASDGSAEIRIENSAHTVRLDLSALQDTTGLNTIGSHPIFFKIASSEKMRLTSTGLGILNSAPTTPLEVNGVVRVNEAAGVSNGTIIIDALATGNPNLAFQQAGTYKGYIHYLDSSDTICLNDGSGNGLHYSPTLKRLGIDTNAPQFPLEINGHTLVNGNLILTGGTDSAERRASITHDGSSMILKASGNSTNKNIIFHKSGDGSGDETMRIDSSGNVGIGVSSILTPSGSRKAVVISNGTNGSAIHFNNLGGEADNPRIFSKLSNTTDLSMAAGGSSGVLTFHTGGGNERMRVNASGKVLINTTVSDNGNVVSSGNGTSGSTACYGLVRGSYKATLGMTSIGDMAIRNFTGEIYVHDSAGNTTTISPHNFSVIPDGASEDLAWSYYARKGDTENDFDNTKYISTDITKVIRKVENLTGDKLIYTGTGSTDDGSTVSQNIIQDLITRIESLEAEVTALKNQP